MGWGGLRWHLCAVPGSGDAKGMGCCCSRGAGGHFEASSGHPADGHCPHPAQTVLSPQLKPGSAAVGQILLLPQAFVWAPALVVSHLEIAFRGMFFPVCLLVTIQSPGCFPYTAGRAEAGLFPCTLLLCPPPASSGLTDPQSGLTRHPVPKLPPKAPALQALRAHLGFCIKPQRLVQSRSLAGSVSVPGWAREPLPEPPAPRLPPPPQQQKCRLSKRGLAGAQRESGFLHRSADATRAASIAPCVYCPCQANRVCLPCEFDALARVKAMQLRRAKANTGAGLRVVTTVGRTFGDEFPSLDVLVTPLPCLQGKDLRTQPPSPRVSLDEASCECVHAWCVHHWGHSGLYG